VMVSQVPSIGGEGRGGERRGGEGRGGEGRGGACGKCAAQLRRTTSAHTAIWCLVFFVKLSVLSYGRRCTRQHLSSNLLRRQLGRRPGQRDTGLAGGEVVVHLSAHLVEQSVAWVSHMQCGKIDGQCKMRQLLRH
jgi:hypothetical protein